MDADADAEAHGHECARSGGPADAGEPEHPGSHIARTQRVDHESEGIRALWRGSIG